MLIANLQFNACLVGAALQSNDLEPDLSLGLMRDRFGDPSNPRFRMQRMSDGSEAIIFFPAGKSDERIYLNYFEHDRTYALQYETNTRGKLRIHWEIPFRFSDLKGNFAADQTIRSSPLLTFLYDRGFSHVGQWPSSALQVICMRRGYAAYKVGPFATDQMDFWFVFPDGKEGEIRAVSRSKLRNNRESLPGIGAPYPISKEESTFLARGKRD